MRGPTVITVTYNNVPFDESLWPAWGFSCLIQGVGKTILFDTGGSGPRLIANMERLGFDPGAVEIVFLSHDHGDHTGGLKDVLERNRNVEVFLLPSFSGGLRHFAETRARSVVLSGKPARVCEAAWTTGEMGRGIPEQAILLETAEGIVVVTGCAHPGILEIVGRAKKIRNRPVHLVMGGFHLAGCGDPEMSRIIEGFRGMGVRKVGPSHCTGGLPTARLREAWGSGFCELGLGGCIEIPGAEAEE